MVSSHAESVDARAMQTHFYNELFEIWNTFSENILGSAPHRIHTVTCRACGQIAETGLTEFPFQSFSVECACCRKEMYYRPSEVTVHIERSLRGSRRTPRAPKLVGHVLNIDGRSSPKPGFTFSHLLRSAAPRAIFRFKEQPNSY